MSIHDIGSSDELTPEKPLVAYVGGVDVAVFRVGERIYGVDRFCPHARGDLSTGHLSDCQLTCPDHKWEFDIVSGACRKKNGTDLKTFTVREIDGRIQLELPDKNTHS